MSAHLTSDLGVADLGTVHLVGIGGAGMSVVAQLLAARGARVQGTDARRSAVTDALVASGIDVQVGHRAEHVAGAQTLVVSSAVREDNPELVAARSAGLRVLHRSQALAILMSGSRAVAVAGAHGKTTTSAMTAVVLREVGLDPSFAIGGSVITETGAVPGGHSGTGDVLVAEADESDGSFLAYRPTVAVVTNVEPDHLDHYGTRAAFEEAFVEFAGNIVPGGTLVACADDAGAAELARRHAAAGGEVVTYGTAPGATALLSGYRVETDGTSAFELTLPGADAASADGLTVRLRAPGLHNALNASAALLAAVRLGVDPAAAVAAVWAFRGTGRRYESRGTVGGVEVVDDYAHHPTEVAALLRAARALVGTGSLRVLFQPHLFSRTRIFAQEFAEALDLADDVVVCDVYAAREDPDPEVGPHLLVDRMTGRGRVVADRVEAATSLAGSAEPGDLVLTVGAGDVTEMGAVVLDALRRRVADGDLPDEGAAPDETTAPTEGAV
ncbi:UDP-N-acetylmuramate--L-alanine ligase [Sanguibacter keddieii DSM 10542]|uniref:UDP-N-acetylmuramate--L-alanine ligase n=1 Tax=Sanguibacter keddieii (strain ATCC 51767 / DSM 10542 / NCFB 3025 / ST-74) TaxID=446469 RepID=D1BIL7_SANKS|nr:UDP-N-acetylmuramate--L-alanine ligase [Sanguibacter keddieii]ACZ22194.1 UDP-N-acetylmuramate--L-alanine ligase [Sanguibacter keddieii DSM 10542]